MYTIVKGRLVALLRMEQKLAAGKQGCTLEKKGKLGPESQDYNIGALIEDNLAVGEVGMMAVYNCLSKYNL